MREIIFLALLDTQTAHWNRSRIGFQELDLSDGQPKVLYILRTMEGCVQKDLAKVCDIKPSSMTAMLDRLEEKGYVRREETKVSGGKRAYRIYLTEAGRQIAEKVFLLMETIEEECFQGISDTERQLLFDLLKRVRDNLVKSSEVCRNGEKR